MKELLGQGRTAAQMRAHEDMADFIAFWIIRLACAVFLACLFYGCAEPVRIYTEGQVTFHEGDISPCERGAAACTVGMRNVYYMHGDLFSLEHERQHLAGGQHGKWVARGYENCAQVTVQGGSSWKVGAWLCRRSDGSFVQREA